MYSSADRPSLSTRQRKSIVYGLDCTYLEFVPAGPATPPLSGLYRGAMVVGTTNRIVEPCTNSSSVTYEMIIVHSFDGGKAPTLIIKLSCDFSSC